MIMSDVECYCTECRTVFKIMRKRGLPPWDLICPVCESKAIDITKINGCEDNQNSL